MFFNVYSRYEHLSVFMIMRVGNSFWVEMEFLHSIPQNKHVVLLWFDLVWHDHTIVLRSIEWLVYPHSPALLHWHYSDDIMNTMASQITSVSIVYSTVCSGVDQGKHQSSASLAFVRGIHRSPVNSSHKGPVTRKTFPLDDVIMGTSIIVIQLQCNWNNHGG